MQPRATRTSLLAWLGTTCQRRVQLTGQGVPRLSAWCKVYDHGSVEWRSVCPARGKREMREMRRESLREISDRSLEGGGQEITGAECSLRMTARCGVLSKARKFWTCLGGGGALKKRLCSDEWAG